MAIFATNTSGAIWWPNLQLMLVVPYCCQVKSKLRSQFLGPLCLWQCLDIDCSSFRVPLLAQPGLDWSVTVDKLPGAFDYYILTMSEGGDEGSGEALSRCMDWPVPDRGLYSSLLREKPPFKKLNF